MKIAFIIYNDLTLLDFAGTYNATLARVEKLSAL